MSIPAPPTCDNLPPESSDAALAANGKAARQRINAEAHVSSKSLTLKTGGSAVSVIEQLHQRGSARIRFPNSSPDALSAVLINTAGGLTGDDSMHWSAAANSDSRLTLSTAACEKLYRSHGPAAVQATNLQVHANARLDWLPQETILFNGGSLNRTLNVQIDESATALVVESLAMGRLAMDETIDQLHLHDRWRLYRAGKLLHAEDLRLDVNSDSSTDRNTNRNTDSNSDCGSNSNIGSSTGSSTDCNAQQQSILHQNGAISTMVFVSPLSEEYLQNMAKRVRNLIGETGIDEAGSSDGTLTAAVTVLKHRLIIRAVARDSFCLRKFLIPCIEPVSYTHLTLPTKA